MWRFDDGGLFHKGELIEYYGFRDDDIEFNERYLTKMQFNIAVSDNSEFCVCYSENGMYCDCFAADDHRLVLTKRRNTYHMENTGFIVKFIGHLLILNEQHSVLSVYDMKEPDNPAFHVLDDVFINNIDIYDGYMLLKGWIWNPIDVYVLFKIEDFIADVSKYKPRMMFLDDMDIVSKDGITIHGEKLYGWDKLIDHNISEYRYAMLYNSRQRNILSVLGGVIDNVAAERIWCLGNLSGIMYPCHVKSLLDINIEESASYNNINKRVINSAIFKTEDETRWSDIDITVHILFLDGTEKRIKMISGTSNEIDIHII